MATTSTGVQAILDGILENYGDIELSEDDAKTIFGGNKACKVKDLAHSNLIQYALLHAHLQIQGLIAQIEHMGKPNRAQRRAAEKKGLILPK